MKIDDGIRCIRGGLMEKSNGRRLCIQYFFMHFCILKIRLTLLDRIESILFTKGLDRKLSIALLTYLMMGLNCKISTCAPIS
jgi:hypothetical protein